MCFKLLITIKSGLRDKQLNLKKTYDKVNHRERVRMAEYRLRESDHEMSKLGRFLTREKMDLTEFREPEILGQKSAKTVIFIVPVKDWVENFCLATICVMKSYG